MPQVYKAKLRSTGETVAVKVQRPQALETISRDLYVMQRAAVIYQGVVDRWTAQRTNYSELLDTWATGFYQELDFLNEGQNQMKFVEMVKDMEGIYVPKVACLSIFRMHRKKIVISVQRPLLACKNK